MNEIIDYRIISGRVSEDLIDNVKMAMADGWQPIGGLVRDGNAGYYQTMVMYQNLDELTSGWFDETLKARSGSCDMSNVNDSKFKG